MEQTDNMVLLVDELYNYQETFVEKFGPEKIPDKERMVKEKAEATLNSLKKIEPATTTTLYMLQYGRVLNILSDYSKECEEYLSKVVKRDPSQITAWNMLGETFWKKGDFLAAKDCFEGAVQRQKNKFSLRSLSMILRQLQPPNIADVSKNILRSVSLAKDAVEMDTNDGTSWYILGNAYLSLFFATEQNPKVLAMALGAYTQSEKVDSSSVYNADLHFNRAQAYRYEEQYSMALEGWKKAKELDQTWTEPELKTNELVQYLTIVSDLVSKKGKLKAKRLNKLISSIKESDLGPYADGGLKTNNSVAALHSVSLSSLSEGINAEKVVVGRVVCNMAGATLVPFTLAMVDQEGTCCAVTIYNLAKGKGMIIGDSVAIPEPFFTRCDVAHGGSTYQFPCIRVHNPVILVVNGKKLTSEHCGFVKASMVATGLA